MKEKRFFTLIATLLLFSIVITSCGTKAVDNESSTDLGQIYLYGEAHGIEKILDEEFLIWKNYYDNNNMRHLFEELPYYTTNFLNIWMQSDNDEILDDIFDDLSDTFLNTPSAKEFYKKIKDQCPETIFHGTDVGHLHNKTGLRYLKYLKSQGLENSEEYRLTEEAIEQGKQYYSGNKDHVYRENTMVENFIREFDQLENKSIMGIYGAAHTDVDSMDWWTDSIPCMAAQLKEKYGDILHSEDLSYLRKQIEPLNIETITIGNNEYEASYFGEEDLTGSKDFKSCKLWRVENAYEDFKDSPKTGDVLPYDNYSIIIEEGQVFVFDCIKTDGSTIRLYYRSDGYIWNDLLVTTGFDLE